MSDVTIQARLTGPTKKSPEAVDGPDDAEVVVVVGRDDAHVDPTVAYMQGKLKATGHTGRLFDALASGEVAAAIARARQHDAG